MVGLDVCPADRGFGGKRVIFAGRKHERVFSQPVEDQIWVRRAHDVYAELHLSPCDRR